MRLLVAVTALFLFAACVARGADDVSKYAVWITGEVFADKDTLLFRADKPVQGNSTGRVVLLGATRDTVKVLLPLYARAAERHAKLRLYGVLLPASDKPKPGVPSVEFITYKLHAPDDPDELPAGQKIIIHPGDAVQAAPNR